MDHSHLLIEDLIVQLLICKKINILGNSIGFDSCGENSMRCLENSSH